MTKWTKEQLLAINETGKNIIVSAGAGSGKTAVLTERVITKLKSGINIQSLLILTFTNAAASEMKDRIRKTIKKDNSLKEQLEYLDSSYITTFDSFSMSLVKKYNYILNIPSDIGVLDKTICDSVRNKIIDEIFEKMYEIKDSDFLKLINDLTIKDDLFIKESIANINTKLDRLINKKEYLNNYIENYYNDNNINKLIILFDKFLKNKINNIESILYEISNYCDSDYYHSISESINGLINSNNYDEILINSDINLPKLPKNSDEELKILKTRMNDEIKSLNSILIYKNTSHIKETLLSTKSYASAIIKIVLELDLRLNNYKEKCNQYEFNDIAKMAINLVKNNNSVKEELTNMFSEIMIDEYQDTSDIQEELMSLISNNNLYMVGDVKQSIYRFRNANPEIFKNKYNLYSNSNEGIKIDLLNNFRSREEVLIDINKIFDLIMDSNIGGADYKVSHRMNFGNTLYSDNKSNQNQNLEILNYTRKDKKFSKSEYEAFIIANDIKNKIESGYKVLDFNTKSLRKCNYQDFCILLDRKSNFELYKKIFEYLGIPLIIYYDEKITNEKDVLIIKNIIDLIIKIYKREFDTKFKYDFYSVLRSYIINETDQSFIDYYINNNYKDSELYKKCLDISKKIDTMSNKNLIDEIIDKFDFYEKTILVGEMEKFIVRVDYLKTLSDNLSSLGYSIMDFNNYLQDMVLNDSDITFSLNVKVSNNVKLMNIHKSKGLEFPICYFAGYESKFNRMDLNNQMNFDNEYGFILPFYDNGVGNTISKELFKYKYNKEDISERIRLLYVALTRSKEKMIIVTNLSEECKDINDNVRSEYLSFWDIIESIKTYLRENIINCDIVNLTKDYNYNNKKKNIIKSNEKKIIVKELTIINNKIEESNASKHINKILTSENVKLLEYGTKIHKMLENTDFYTSNNNIVDKIKEKFDISKCKIYKEYEFITLNDNKEYHGIIDLILEYDDHIDIIDYKLKNISDDGYKKQLGIYKDYITNKTNKDVNTYLYSIIDDIFVIVK